MQNDCVTILHNVKLLKTSKFENSILYYILYPINTNTPFARELNDEFSCNRQKKCLRKFFFFRSC